MDPALPHHDTATPSQYVHGHARIRRIGRWRFPVYELVQGDESLARLGRMGMLKIYFGSGQRIELADGTPWVMASNSVGGTICPTLYAVGRGKVAMSGLSHGTYAINTEHQAWLFYPTARRTLGRSQWLLSEHDRDVANLYLRQLRIEAHEPVPLGVVLLCFTLAKFGVVGETAPRLPAFTWAKP